MDTASTGGPRQGSPTAPASSDGPGFESPTSTPPPMTTYAMDGPCAVSEESVRSFFRKQNTRKAPGPDRVSPSVLKACAEQLAPVFADIFNRSLDLCTVPDCFKSATIVPVPKRAKVSSLNDYRPVALTSVVMKVLERIVLSQLKSATNHLLDPLQFAYRSGRSVDDAVSLLMHYLLNHADKPKSYARILFIDFSSAFNTIIPDKLHSKLLSLNVNPQLCHWLIDFLSNRTQSVRINGLSSNSITLNTGAPQGCVLSPILFTLYTNDCRSSHGSVKLFKFSDDSTLEGLISNGDESSYMEEVSKLVQWCDTNSLELNVSKTKEMIIDFRRVKSTIAPLIIKDQEVDIVDTFKFLGSTISNDLKWEANTSEIISKCHQRLYFLRKLKKFGVGKDTLVNFYRATIESILTFSITSWFTSLTEFDKNRLSRIVHISSKITGASLKSIDSIYHERSTKKVKSILADTEHPANCLFDILPSGKRFRSIPAKTNRFKNSFFVSAVRESCPQS